MGTHEKSYRRQGAARRAHCGNCGDANVEVVSPSPTSSTDLFSNKDVLRSILQHLDPGSAVRMGCGDVTREKRRKCHAHLSAVCILCAGRLVGVD